MKRGFGKLHGGYKDDVDYDECSDAHVLRGHNANQKVGSLFSQNLMQDRRKSFPVCAGSKSSAITALGLGICRGFDKLTHRAWHTVRTQIEEKCARTLEFPFSSTRGENTANSAPG